MKSGYYVYNNEKYRFELNNEYMTVVNENGYNFTKFIDKLNGKYKEENKMQILKVKMFPKWNDAIIFHNENLDSIGGVSTFKIFGIIEFKNIETNIDAINIYSDEIDYIYNSTRVINNMDYSKNGKFSFSTKSFADTNSIKKKIHMDEQEITYGFEINRKIVDNINYCFEADTLLKYEFENTLEEDYHFIYRIIRVTRIFITYLYYRQNVSFRKIELLSRLENDKYISVAEMEFFNNISLVTDKYLKEYHIKYDYIKDIDDKILQSIIDNDVFIRHIPKDEIERNKINPQSFVIVSSAFEWEFRRLFSNGVAHRKSKVTNIAEIKDDLKKICQKYSKSKKKIISNIIRNVGKDNLESKVSFASRQLEDVSKIFLKQLCDLNNVGKPSQLFTDLQKLRNCFSHGELDIDINSDGFTGIIYLERLIYIMQLKRFGLDDKNTKKAINKLFCCRITL